VRDCECHGPGYCERHGVKKTAVWVELCQTNDAYWRAWEAGRGPGQLHSGKSASQHVDRPNGWGDKLTSLLKSVGVTEENYKAVKQKFGLPPTCGCAARREWLNRVGRWLTGQEETHGNTN
jgi:hypothetical protein